MLTYIQCYQSKCLLICKDPSKHEKDLSELNQSKTIKRIKFYCKKGVNFASIYLKFDKREYTIKLFVNDDTYYFN